MTLNEYLQDKPLAYADFDPTRIVKVWENIKKHFSLPPVIRLVGTNGKGSTGRFVAQYLHAQDISVGHYTSPHIHHLNERFWLNGKEIKESLLESAHKSLFSLLTLQALDTLSYFEYTTLLALKLFNNCDYIVLETGLGGEYDATNIVTSTLTLITPIDLDHQNFLGDNIKAIAHTKLHINTKAIIVGYQHHPEVYDIAKKEAAHCHYNCTLLNDMYPQNHDLHYLEQNKVLALCALESLGFTLDISQIGTLSLFGRCSKIAPNITIDVGHNPLAAKALLKSFDTPITLIYNTLEDKEYQYILQILKPIIHHLLILEINKEVEPRIVDIKELEITLASLNIPFSFYKNINPNENYLVFGSFKAVERFMLDYQR